MKFSNSFLRRCMYAAAAGIASVTLPAQAGGLYIGEFGQPNQGASGAGANAIAEDASTAFQNPAGVMFLDRSQSMATGFIIDSKVEFDGDSAASAVAPSVTNADGSRPASDGGDGGSTAVGGAFFHANPVNDKWGWGFAFASISGASLEYEDKGDFAGRYWATEVELLTVNMVPSISYLINEDLAVSFSVPIMYGQLDLDVAIPSLTDAGLVAEGFAQVKDGDDWTATFGASALWQATSELRLGLMYAYETELDFDSDLKITPPATAPASTVGSNVEWTYPQTLRLSATYDLNEKYTLLSSIAWEDWSTFDDIYISTAVGGGTLPRNWDDTWHYALGLRWYGSNRMTYYTGIAYDTDPTTASDRTADMPIDEQWRYSFGANYERENGHKIGGVITYADYGDAEIDNGGARPVTGTPWTVKGDYDTNRLIFLGINYGW
jgi:long-chain fatty acid transport protein